MLDLVRREDPEAAARLYDRFYDDVGRLVFRLLGPDSERDDLVQDVFIRILAGARRVRDARALPSWVMTVTVNTVRKELRRRKTRHTWIGWAAPEDTEVAIDPPDFEGRDLLLRVYTLLEQLPADDRIAFVLRNLDERTIDEVAALCGCSTGTVKRRVRRATDRFAKLVAGQPELAAWLGPRPKGAS